MPILATLTPFITPAVILFIAGIGATVAYGRLNKTVEIIKDEVMPKGKPRLVSKDAFTVSQDALTDKLKDVGKQIEAMDQKRERAREGIQSELKQIAHFMGKVEQYMLDN